MSFITLHLSPEWFPSWGRNIGVGEEHTTQEGFSYNICAGLEHFLRMVSKVIHCNECIALVLTLVLR